MPEKKTVDLSNVHRLLHPKLTVLLTCADTERKANIITLAWIMPVSSEPPLMVVSISPKRYSYRLIRRTGEFVINIPTMKIVKQALFCGRRTGKEHDKFKETKLTPLPAKTVKAPIIKECIAHLECKLYKQIPAGDHSLLIGEIQTAYADENIFSSKYDLEKAKLVFHLGGDSFTTISHEVITPRLPPDKKKHKQTVPKKSF